jgi:hypothetical protein
LAGQLGIRHQQIKGLHSHVITRSCCIGLLVDLPAISAGSAFFLK